MSSTTLPEAVGLPGRQGIEHKSQAPSSLQGDSTSPAPEQNHHQDTSAPEDTITINIAAAREGRMEDVYAVCAIGGLIVGGPVVAAALYYTPIAYTAATGIILLTFVWVSDGNFASTRNHLTRSSGGMLVSRVSQPRL
jgi:hypothetical protein